jgi:hypothetical protein
MAAEHHPGIDPQDQADGEAVLRHLTNGTPLDPAVIRRVQERAARVTEEIRRLHGEIDAETLNALFRDDDETGSTSSMPPLPPPGFCRTRSR